MATLEELITAGSAPAEDYGQVLADRQFYASDLRENAARPATVCLTFDTTGIGQILPGDPMLFNLVFTEQPYISTGLYVHQLPDPNHWLYPQVTAGVRSWVTRENPADAGKAATDPTRKPFYVGAYLYFIVTCAPVSPPQTDGSDHAYLLQRYADQQTELERVQLTSDVNTVNSIAQFRSALEEKLIEVAALQASGLGDALAVAQRQLLQLQAQLTYEQDRLLNTIPSTLQAYDLQYQINLLKRHIADATESLYLQAHPPQVVITHNLVFQQQAIKPLPDNVMASLDTDPTLAPTALY